MKTFIVILCLAVGMPSWAAAPADAAQATAAPAQRLVLGRTRLDEARQIWNETGAQVVQSGQVSVGAGSGADGLGTIGVPELLLVDVTGVDFEGLGAVRYAFVEGVLYSMQSRLQPPVPGRDQGRIFPPLSDADVSALDQRLRKAYGAPTRSGADPPHERNAKPNIFIWNLGDREMTLTVRATFSGGSQLIVTHKELAKAAQNFRRAACKQHKGCVPN